MSATSCTNSTALRYIFALLTVLIWAGTAEAQGPGVRGGVSIDPDQGYFGAHYETGALVDRLHFRPNVEAGLGDDLTTISLNFEFAYKFPSRSGWQLYAGGRAGGELLHLRHRGTTTTPRPTPGSTSCLASSSARACSSSSSWA